MNLDDMTEDELSDLARNGTDEEKRAVARHPNASLKTLLHLGMIGFAEDVDQNPLLLLHVEGGSYDAVDVLSEIARQTNRSERLEELAQSVWSDVRFFVARNRYSPVSALEKLSKDKKYDVRNGVAKNESTPANILAILANDFWPSVRLHVARNEGKVNRDILVKLAKDEDPLVVLAAKEALEKLE